MIEFFEKNNKEIIDKNNSLKDWEKVLKDREEDGFKNNDDIEDRIAISYIELFKTEMYSNQGFKYTRYNDFLSHRKFLENRLESLKKKNMPFGHIEKALDDNKVGFAEFED